MCCNSTEKLVVRFHWCSAPIPAKGKAHQQQWCLLGTVDKSQKRGNEPTATTHTASDENGYRRISSISYLFSYLWSNSDSNTDNVNHVE